MWIADYVPNIGRHFDRERRHCPDHTRLCLNRSINSISRNFRSKISSKIFKISKNLLWSQSLPVHPSWQIQRKSPTWLIHPFELTHLLLYLHSSTSKIIFKGTQHKFFDSWMVMKEHQNRHDLEWIKKWFWKVLFKSLKLLIEKTWEIKLRIDILLKKHPIHFIYSFAENWYFCEKSPDFRGIFLEIFICIFQCIT